MASKVRFTKQGNYWVYEPNPRLLATHSTDKFKGMSGVVAFCNGPCHEKESKIRKVKYPLSTYSDSDIERIEAQYENCPKCVIEHKRKFINRKENNNKYKLNEPSIKRDNKKMKSFSELFGRNLSSDNMALAETLVGQGLATFQKAVYRNNIANSVIGIAGLLANEAVGRKVPGKKPSNWLRSYGTNLSLGIVDMFSGSANPTYGTWDNALRMIKGRNYKGIFQGGPSIIGDIANRIKSSKPLVKAKAAIERLGRGSPSVVTPGVSKKLVTVYGKSDRDIIDY